MLEYFPGKGELLKLGLELGDACQKKKSRPLAVSYVYIDVDFSKQVEVKTFTSFCSNSLCRLTCESGVERRAIYRRDLLLFQEGLQSDGHYPYDSSDRKAESGEDTHSVFSTVFLL